MRSVDFINFTRLKSRYSSIGSWIYNRNTFIYDYTKEKYWLYKVTDHDSLHSLAYKYLGNSCYYWIIGEINNIIDPFVPLKDYSGQNLKIPYADIINRIK